MTEGPQDPELSAAIEHSALLSTPDPGRVRDAARWGRTIAGVVGTLWALACLDALLGGPVVGRVPDIVGPFPLASSLGLALLGCALALRPDVARWRLTLISGVLLLALLSGLREVVGTTSDTSPTDTLQDATPVLLMLCLAVLALALAAVHAGREILAQRLALVPLGLGIILTNAIVFDPRALAELSVIGEMSILAPPTLAALALSALMQTAGTGFVALGMANDESSRNLRRNLPLAVAGLDGAMLLGYTLSRSGITSRGLGLGLGTGIVVFIGGVIVWTQSSRFHDLDMRRLGAEHVMERVRRALSERDSLARRLDASQQRLQQVLDSSIDPYVAIDTSGRVTEWNIAATEMFGWTHDEAVDSPLDTLIVPEDQRGAHRAGVARYLSTGEMTIMGRPVELVGMRKDRSLVDVEVRVWPIDDQEGTHFHAFIRDVTERKRAQAELLQANRELEEFAAVAAHDLRSPLVAITLTAELIVQQAAEGHHDSTTEWANRILESTRRGGELINDLLALSQVSSSQRRRATVSLGALVREVADEVVGASTRPGTVTVTALPDISGDVVLIRQLFTNLISNSFKYVPADRDPQVTVTARSRPGGLVELTVQDNGDGIPEADVGRVFDMFHRGENTEGSPGSGIGLAICRRVVERHGGTIWVSNRPGAGAQFDISLPVGGTSAHP